MAGCVRAGTVACWRLPRAVPCARPSCSVVLQTAPREYRRRTTERRLRLRGLGPDAVAERVRERIEARKAKDFVRSDAIRANLEALGVSLHDSPDGSTWKIDV